MVRSVDTARHVDVLAYRVTIDAGALDRSAATIRAVAPAHRYAIISDDVVAPLYGDRVAHGLSSDHVRTFTVPTGEEQKTRAAWAQLTDELLAAGFGRDSAVIALGGGVIGDLAGFVAATFMRGIPWVQLPTTLLAMVDASIGGKTAVDTPAGKNLVGAFHQPAGVIVDPMTLTTLPLPHVRAGLAEIIKHGVIADEAYFDRTVAALPTLIDQRSPDWLDVIADLVVRSVEIKAAVVAQDEREHGPRKTLNFGHTIGHAIERCTRYTILHGDAVAIGMVIEADIAERLGLAARGTRERVRNAVAAAGLPSRMPAEIAAADVIAATRTDKKARRGAVEYALPARIGVMAGRDHGWACAVDDDVVREVLTAS